MTEEKKLVHAFLTEQNEEHHMNNVEQLTKNILSKNFIEAKENFNHIFSSRIHKLIEVMKKGEGKKMLKGNKKDEFDSNKYGVNKNDDDKEMDK